MLFGMQNGTAFVADGGSQSGVDHGVPASCNETGSTSGVLPIEINARIRFFRLDNRRHPHACMQTDSYAGNTTPQRKLVNMIKVLFAVHDNPVCGGLFIPPPLNRSSTDTDSGKENELLLPTISSSSSIVLRARQIA